MSSRAPQGSRPQLEQSGASDASLQAVHDELTQKKPEEKVGYSPMPLALLGVMSGLILVTAIFFVHNVGGFDPLAYDGRYVPKAAGGPAPIDPVKVGKALFNSGGACFTCHQANGLGAPGLYPPLAHSEWVTGSEEKLIRIVLHGLKGPVQVSGTTFPGTVEMPSFGLGGQYNWTDDKLAHVLTYIRQEWGNQAGPITPEKVAEIRNAVKHNDKWTATELETVK